MPRGGRFGEDGPIMADSAPRERGFAFVRSSRLWLYILVAGAVVWLLVALIVALTNDTILVPTLLIVGSFFVPLSMVAFAASRPAETALGLDALALGFLGGGTVGLMCAALTEVEVLPSAAGTFVSVGLIEEGAKGVVLLLVARGVRTRDPLHGLVLGATVGAGFAAFESTGYALQALMDHTRDHPVVNVVGTEAGRALLAPFGHITWTALLGGALFAAASPTGTFRVTPKVLATFAGVVVLHAAWDATYGVSILAGDGLAGDGWRLDWPNTAQYAGTPTGGDLVLFDAAYCALIALNVLLGTLWVLLRYRAVRPARPRAPR
jgi:RsiW-degrading membrane proteinase PrsW (M82 family)